MNLRKSILLTLISLIGLMLSACVAPTAAPAGGDSSDSDGEMAAFVPSSPECIAPANPGGGWDFTCRAGTKAMNDAGVVEDSFTVTNMAGGGGGIAFASVVSERNEDNNLIVAASPGTTARLAQNQYEGFTEDDVRWLGALGADFGMIAVAADSAYETLDDLIAALQADPTSVNFGGGSAAGGQDHMKVLLMAQQIDVDPLAIQYTAFDGGGEASTALLGGFIDAFPGDASELKGLVESGDIRVLVTLSPERLPAPYDEVSTAQELGFDVEWVIFRGYWGPGGMSEEAYDYWVDALTQTAASPEWAEARDQGGLAEFFMAGEEFETMIRDQVGNLRQLSKDIGIIE